MPNGSSSNVSVVGDADITEGPSASLHVIPPYQLSERPRRPSMARNDSTDHTIPTLKDAAAVAESNGKNSTISLAYPPRQSAASAAELAANAKEIKRAGNLQMFACCWTALVVGWNDGATGPLLPVIQREYNVGLTVVSLLFVTNCVGFLLGAVANVWLTNNLGLGKAMVLASLVQFSAYIIEIPAPPFPAMLVAFLICGFSLSILIAQTNGMLGSLKHHKSTKLSIYHACYGFGAFLSPFLATYFSTQRHWSFHYISSALMAISNTVVVASIFRLKPLPQLLTEAGEDLPNDNGESTTGGPVSENPSFSHLFRLKAVHFLAIFAIIYVGVEVTMSGWIVTFVIRERDAGPKAGYISSGFFAGLTIGRLALMWLNKKIGEHRAIFVYTAVCIVLEITVWFVPSIIENSIAVALIGVLLGPMFPILVSHASRILPRVLLTSSLGYISGLGQSGSAALPFITGIIASQHGISSLQPFMVAMMCLMAGTWALVPKTRRMD